MGLFGKDNKNSFEDWPEKSSYKKLGEGYGKRGQIWLKNGDGDKTYEMNKINGKMVRQTNGKYEKSTRMQIQYSMDNGWYLSSDD